MDGRPERDPAGSGAPAVEPVRGPGGRWFGQPPLAILGLAAAVAIVGLSLVGSLARAPATGPGATTRPEPSLAVVEAPGDALDTVARIAGWVPCPVWRGFGTVVPVDPAGVDAAIARGAGPGRLTIAAPATASAEVVLGGDVRAAALAFGGRALVDGSDGTRWAVVDEAAGTIALRIDEAETPGGRRFWQVLDRARPAPWCAASPPSPVAPVAVVRRPGDSQAVLRDELGWGRCETWQWFVERRLPDGTAIDAAAAAAATPRRPGGRGWVDVPSSAGLLRVWVGDDEGSMARAHGARTVAIGERTPSSAWLALSFEGRPLTVELRRLVTPAGRVAWIPTGNAAGVLGACAAAVGAR